MAHAKKRLNEKTIRAEELIRLASPVIHNHPFPSEATDDYRRADDHEEIQPRTCQNVDYIGMPQQLPQLPTKNRAAQEGPNAADSFEKAQALRKRQVRVQCVVVNRDAPQNIAILGIGGIEPGALGRQAAAPANIFAAFSRYTRLRLASGRPNPFRLQ